MHPFGIWENPHEEGNEFMWRNSNGTGAFGPGGKIDTVAFNIITILPNYKLQNIFFNISFN